MNREPDLAEKPNRIPGFYACIATMTLGPPDTCPLLAKMRIAKDMKFQAIELYWPDFEAFTLDLKGKQDWDAYIETAIVVRHFCNELGLEIASLQPLFAENFLPDLDEQTVQLWRSVAHILDVSLIGAVPILQDGGTPAYQGSPATSKSLETLLNSLRDVDVGYEFICFANDPPCWEKAYQDIICANQRKCQTSEETGLGLVPVQNRCRIIMDTFNICARLSPFRSADIEALCCYPLDRTLDNMRTILKTHDIGLIQVADGEQFMGSVDGHLLDHDQWMSAFKMWSRNHRCLPLISDNGCLPVIAVLKALTEKPDNTGYRGYISLEVFRQPTEEVPRDVIEQAGDYPWDGSMREFGMPSAYALWCGQRARESWVALCDEMNWEVDCEMPSS